MFRRKVGRLSTFALLAVLLASFFAFAPINPIETKAQPPCLLRTDWPIYIVRYGDTLGRIAQRYRTTLWTLMSANCLTNANRIYVGQRLYVPPFGPRPSPTSPNPGPGFNIPITFQLFENGFMVFRADKGDIWVFGGTGQYFRNFAPAVYGPLPDNPVPDPTPAFRIRPIMGFGKVWGNFPEVRAFLGWGVESERSFISFYQPAVYPNLFTVTLPGNRTVRVFRNAYGVNNWLFLSGGIQTPTPIPVTLTPIPPTVTPGTGTTGASYQLFENGIMLYRADLGAIYVLVNDGRFFPFSPAQYGGLPDNPVTRPTPPGRYRPIFGFGKVWGNNWYIRASVGWAVTPETGYVATVQQPNGDLLLMSLPDTRRIRFLFTNITWTFADGTLPPLKAVSDVGQEGESGQPTPTAIPTDIQPLPTIVPTFTPVPTEPGPNPTIQTSAAFQSFQNGFMVWRADTREIWVFYGGNAGVITRFGPGMYEGMPDNPVGEEAPAGYIKPISGFGRVWGNYPEVRNGLSWATTGEAPYTLTLEQIGTSNDGPIYKMTLPSGASVTINGNTWNL